MRKQLAVPVLVSRLWLIVPILAIGWGFTPAWGQPRQPPKEKPKSWRDQPLDDESVNTAVENAVNYLFSAKAMTRAPNTTAPEGHWELKPIEEYKKALNPKDKAALLTLNGLVGIYGGNTSLVLLALLKSGVSIDDERVQKAIRFLQEVKPNQTYANALRGALFATINKNGKYQAEVKYEKEWLLAAMFSDGLYGYNPPASDDARLKIGEAHRDLSCTQYAALGMWLLSDAGVEVPDKFWQMLQEGAPAKLSPDGKPIKRGYLGSQLPDGSWNYGPTRPGEKGYQSLTLGALATLFIIWDKLYTTRCDQTAPDELRKSIDHGLEWLAANFDPSVNAGRPDKIWFVLYTLYGVERVGVASGLKYFGDKNWWNLAARYILYTQQADGSWPACHENAPPPITTAWALLFLSYGRAPVVFNKLDYGGPAQWNNRPRDLARLTAWMGRIYEQIYSWQVMPIERPVEELLDAPILMMSGKAALKLTDEQKAKLKEYVLGGGLLFGQADDHSKLFCESFRALARELFGELEMSPLAETHPIYNVHFRLRDKPGAPGAGGAVGPVGGGAVPPLEGLSNGIRTLVVLCPRDLSCAWQRNELASSRRSFELGANLMEYVGDRGKGLLNRGNSYMARDQGLKPAARVTVGRLVWGGKYGWDPEPRAWKRLDISLRNARQLGVTTQPCDFTAPVDAKAIPIVHVTGTSAITLTDVQKDHLKQYVTGGGVLFSDAAGSGAGQGRFNESYTKLIGELFGPLVPATLEGSPDFLDAATDKGEVQLRHIGGLPRSTRKLQLLGWRQGGGPQSPTVAAGGPPNRWAVLHLPYDLTAALLGNPNIEPAGLTPAAAEQFMAALLNWVAKK